MVIAGAATAAVCLVWGRGWKTVPVCMVFGGMWAVIPDVPAMIRHVRPEGMLASVFGSEQVKAWLAGHGDWFFFHRSLEVLAARLSGLGGLVVIVAAYNIIVFTLMRDNDRKAHSLARLEYRLFTRARAHGNGLAASGRPRRDRHEVTRRDGARSGSGQPIEAVAVDPVHQTLRPLQDAVLADFGTGGLAVLAATSVEPGSTLYLRPHDTTTRAASKQVAAVVLERMPAEGRYKLRCRSLGAVAPAQVFEAA